MKLVSYFIHYYKLTFMIIIGGFLLGVIGLSTLRKETYPPVDYAIVNVTTHHPGSSAKEIEENITNKLEQKFKDIPSIRKSHSISKPNTSSIRLYLDLNTDTAKTITAIHRAIQNTKLPKALLSPPQVRHYTANDTPIIKIAVIDKQKNPSTSYQNKRLIHKKAYELKSILENLPDVSYITLKGFHKREFQVLLDPYEINKKSIDFQEVISAIKKHHNTSAGRILSPTQHYWTYVIGKIDDIEDLKNIVIRSNFSGKQIFLKDIALVKDAKADFTTSVFVNGKNAVQLNVVKKQNTDSIKTIRQIKNKITEYKKNINNQVQIQSLFDESTVSKKRLSIVTNNAIIGFLLVVLILLISLPTYLGFVSALSLPFCILATVAVISTMGITFNAISMCAFIICLGMIVDNSIVISENYVQYRSQLHPPIKSAVFAVQEMAKPMLAATITTILAFFPMLITKGVMGQFIKCIPIIVSIALVISLIEAIFLLPARLRFTMLLPVSYKKNTFFDFEKWKGIITIIIQKKYLSCVVLLSVLIISLYVGFTKNKFVMFDHKVKSIYTAYFNMNKGTPFTLLKQKALALETQVRPILGESNIQYTNIQLNSIKSSGQLVVKIKPNKVQQLNYKYKLKQLHRIKAFKVLRFSTGQSHGPKIGHAVEFVLSSQSQKQLSSAVKKIKSKLQTVNGLIHTRDNSSYTGPEYVIQSNNKVLSRMGLSTQSIGLALQTALTGHIAGEVTQNGEQFYIRVKYNNEGRSNMELLKQIAIPSSNGPLIPLKHITQWVPNKKGTEIKNHYNFKPSLSFKANIDPLKTTSMQANLQIQKILQNIKKQYPALSYKLTGEHETSKESISSLMKAMLLTALAIFIVLLIMFNSFSVSFLILSNVLFGWIGISWIFLLMGKPLSFPALIGSIGLSGVVINSSIILISCIENLKKQYPDKTLLDILVLASMRRLRPILMTTATTVFGLLPTAYGGYDSTLIAITLSLTWGLISGTLLTLIWTPCVYAIIQECTHKLSDKLSHKLPKNYKKSL